MSLWGRVKGAGRAVFDATPAGMVYNAATGGVGNAAKRTPIGRLATGVYDAAYGGPSEQVKQGYSDAASATRRAGQTAAGMYGQARDRSMGYYSDANRMVNQHVPTYSQSYYQNFDRYQPTLAQSYFQQRQQSGYQNPMLGRLAQRQGTENQSYLEDSLGTFRDFATGGTNTEQRMNERRDLYSTPEHLDNRYGERQQFTSQPTNTSGVLNDMTNYDYGARADNARGFVAGEDFGLNMRNFDDLLASGQTAGGRMISDLASGNTAAGRRMSTLEGGGGDTGAFLRDFNMNDRGALGETYDTLKAEGPTYEEDFYTSLLQGGNPHFNQLKDDFLKDTTRRAATTGGFMSGRTADLTTRGLSRLTADEFANRGQLASMAGSARRDQLGQRLDAAGALDSNMLGRAGLRADVASGRDSMISDLAMQGDDIRAGLAGQQDDIRAGFATSRDANRLEQAGLISDLAQFSDTEGRLGLGQRMEGAGQQDDLLRRDQDSLDDLAGRISDRDADRQGALDDLAGSADTTRTTRMSNLGTQLSTADVNRETRRSNVDALTSDTSQSIFDRDKQIDDLADRAATEQENIAGRRMDAAGAASDEAGTRAKDAFDRAMQVGDARAAIDQAYTMAQVGALTNTELSAIGHELARSGVDAATIQALIGDLLTIGKEAGKAYASGGKAPA